ncbi:MAG: DUF5362 family protein [Candidatus Alcyoniella australis]|nr:DUF5362 family protein [Candidatus Alcyoniella australis]
MTDKQNKQEKPQIEPVKPQTIKVELSSADMQIVQSIRRWSSISGWCVLLLGIAEMLTLFGIPAGVLMLLLGIHLLALSRNAEAFQEHREAQALAEIGRRVKLSLIYAGIISLLFFLVFAAMLTVSLVTKSGILSLLTG